MLVLNILPILVGFCPVLYHRLNSQLFNSFLCEIQTIRIVARISDTFNMPLLVFIDVRDYQIRESNIFTASSNGGLKIL